MYFFNLNNSIEHYQTLWSAEKRQNIVIMPLFNVYKNIKIISTQNCCLSLNTLSSFWLFGLNAHLRKYWNLKFITVIKIEELLENIHEQYQNRNNEFILWRNKGLYKYPESKKLIRRGKESLTFINTRDLQNR